MDSTCKVVQLDRYRQAIREKDVAARTHGGDPSVYVGLLDEKNASMDRVLSTLSGRVRSVLAERAGLVADLVSEAGPSRSPSRLFKVLDGGKG